MRKSSNSIPDDIHPTTNINGAEIDVELTELLSSFWQLGGRSYGSCQGTPNLNNPEDYEEAYIIIHKDDLGILEQIAKSVGWNIGDIENGSGSYMCEWIPNDELPPQEELLYIVLNR